jgi:hypothetical protein
VRLLAACESKSIKAGHILCRYKLVAYCTATVTHCTATVTHCTATVTHCTATVTYCTATVTRCTATVTRCTATVTHCTATVTHCTATVTHCTATVTHCTATVTYFLQHERKSTKFYSVFTFPQQNPHTRINITLVIHFQILSVSKPGARYLWMSFCS